MEYEMCGVIASSGRVLYLVFQAFFSKKMNTCFLKEK